MIGAGFCRPKKRPVGIDFPGQHFWQWQERLRPDQYRQDQPNIALSFTDPYFTVDGISQGWDFYHRNVNPTSLTVGRYRHEFDRRRYPFRVPHCRKETGPSGPGFDKTAWRASATAPPLHRFRSNSGNSTFRFRFRSAGHLTASDSFIYPTSGTLRSSPGSGRTGGDLKYYRATYQLQHFLPVKWRFRTRPQWPGWLCPMVSEARAAVLQELLRWGIGSVRGYASGEPGASGQQNGVLTDERLGAIGWCWVAPNCWGVPGSKSLCAWGCLSTLGNVYAKGEQLDFGELIGSAGISAAWISPLALKFSVAAPINKTATRPNDSSSRWERLLIQEYRVDESQTFVAAWSIAALAAGSVSADQLKIWLVTYPAHLPRCSGGGQSGQEAGRNFQA